MRYLLIGLLTFTAVLLAFTQKPAFPLGVSLLITGPVVLIISGLSLKYYEGEEVTSHPLFWIGVGVAVSVSGLLLIASSSDAF